MKRCVWIFTALIFCAFALPPSMTSFLQLGVQNAFAAEQHDPYGQDQPLTTKPAKKKRAHAGQKKKESVQKNAAEKKAAAKSAKKRKKKHSADPAASPN